MLQGIPDFDVFIFLTALIAGRQRSVISNLRAIVFRTTSAGSRLPGGDLSVARPILSWLVSERFNVFERIGGIALYSGQSLCLCQPSDIPGSICLRALLNRIIGERLAGFTVGLKGWRDRNDYAKLWSA
jgi:hypothetical protein